MKKDLMIFTWGIINLLVVYYFVLDSHNGYFVFGYFVLSLVVLNLLLTSQFPKSSKSSKDDFKEIKPKEVSIGNQVWMTENLNVDRFRNGDRIPQAKTSEEWRKAGANEQPAWCYFDNDPENGKKYGKLYNWYTVNDPRGIAPIGFHVPSDDEWVQLVDYLGRDAGKKMKSKRGWDNYTTGGEYDDLSITCPNCKKWNDEYRSKVPCHKCKDTRIVVAPEESFSGNGTNDARFFGLPGGSRCRPTGSAATFGNYYDIGSYGYWWSSTSSKFTHQAVYLQLRYFNGYAKRDDGSKDYGFSVRCLRD